MPRVLITDVISTLDTLRLIQEIAHMLFLTSCIFLAFPCFDLCVCAFVYMGLCTCTLGLSRLGLWKVPGQTPSSNNKRQSYQTHWAAQAYFNMGKQAGISRDEL